MGKNADSSRCVNTNEYCPGNCTVIGEVTSHFELAKPRGLLRPHVRYNFDGDPLRLVVYRANLMILSWFGNFK